MLALMLMMVAVDLGPVVERHVVPAVAIAAVDGSGEVLLQNQTGVTHAGGEPVDADSLWHVGSCTKAMTALLAATCVRDELIDWDTTAGDVLPDLADTPIADVTLRQLLTNTSGIVDPPGDIAFMRGLDGPLREQRLAFLDFLAEQPHGAGGYAYSNGGFVLAGALLEAVTDEAWEVLMAERLFEPLGITTAGFGPPPNGHPRGHLDGESFDPADPMADNPQLAGPAGTVHMSAVDFAKIAAVHIRGPLAAKLNLPDDAWDVLHTPIEESYAAGLIVVEQPWTNGTAFTHSGSNTLWFATMWIVPGRDVAVVVCTNVMNDAAANDAILLALRELDRDW